jgi:hypothetical protein
MNSPYQNRTLTQSLAIQSQIHLPGTVGRILSQIRQIEQVAPLFVKAGLVKSIDRPNPLNLKAAGIATQSAIGKTLGGYLYIAAASRLDLAIDHNAVSTVGQDSACELDDISFEDQAKRLQLIGIRQAYEMADTALKSGSFYDLMILDCPLLLERSMVPKSEQSKDFQEAFDRTRQTISNFWKTHQDHLLPWNPAGTAVLGLTSKRYGAIVHIAREDLSTPDGQRQILETEAINHPQLKPLHELAASISGIGESRFVHGILGSYTRTAAFQTNIRYNRMEPLDITKLGLVGLHFRAAQNTGPLLMQLVGNAPEWTAPLIDRVCSQVMALMVVGGQDAMPLPIQLAASEQKILNKFLQIYSQNIKGALKERKVEELWLSSLDEEF